MYEAGEGAKNIHSVRVGPVGKTSVAPARRRARQGCQLGLPIVHKPSISWYQFEVSRAGAVHGLLRSVDDREVGNTDFDLSIAPMAKDLLDIEPQPGERAVAFLRRYAAFLRIDVLDTTDYCCRFSLRCLSLRRGLMRSSDPLYSSAASKRIPLSPGYGSSCRTSL